MIWDIPVKFNKLFLIPFPRFLHLLHETQMETKQVKMTDATTRATPMLVDGTIFSNVFRLNLLVKSLLLEFVLVEEGAELMLIEGLPKCSTSKMF